MARSLSVGLTGGIACGKSRVLRRLAQKGCAVMDLDRIAHEVTAPGGPAHAGVVAAFGDAVVGRGGAIDRARLGAIVFADPEARARLEAIVHPAVRVAEAALRQRLEEEGARVIVSEAALLVEAGAHLRFDRLVVVHCPPDEQLRRLIARDGIAEPAARARLAAQMPIGEKVRFAHRAVDTGGTPEDTDTGADACARALEDEARSPRARAPLDRARVAALLQAAPGSRALLAEALAAGDLELLRVTPLVSPGETWPRVLEAPPEESARPEELAVAVALWSARRGGPDPDWTAAAMASIARARCAPAAAAAAAVLAALSLEHAAHALGAAPAALAALARRWAGAPPPDRPGEATLAALAALAGRVPAGEPDGEALRLAAALVA